MTQQEQSLADEKMRAEIARLIAETAKLNTENKYYVFIVAAGIATAMVAVGKLFV